MAEHKTQSLYRGQETNRGRDQQQRADGRGEFGSTNQK